MNPLFKKLLVTAVATGLAAGSLALAQDEKKADEGAPAAAKKDDGCSHPDGCGGKKMEKSHSDKKKMRNKKGKEVPPPAADAAGKPEGT
jgi:hypothetical protein